jgi:hypothetical protein
MPMNLAAIPPTCCLIHCKRLIDLWLSDPAEAQHWHAVIAQCRAYHGTGLHCWLERDGQVYDLTRDRRARSRRRFYGRVGVIQSATLDASELWREIWLANAELTSAVETLWRHPELIDRMLTTPIREVWDQIWDETGEDDVELTLLYPLDERIFARWE